MSAMRPTQGDLSDVEVYLEGLQTRICEAFEDEDGSSRFLEDRWSRSGGGGGLTRVLRGGFVFEQAGINFHRVHAPVLPATATASRPDLAGCGFRAMGVSVVSHPRNPFVPTSHASIRLFVAERAGTAPAWWFGGGFDLTPFYPFEEDVRSWHRAAKTACEPFGPDVHARFKTWCDEHFYLNHRGEPRGVGGIYFDELNAWGFDRSFEFVRSVGEAYLLAYVPIVRSRKATPWGEREREFQSYRRGRYLEFNLVHGCGGSLGLHGCRTESNLMSLPPLVQWRDDWSPEPGSREAALGETFLKPRDWV